MSEPAKVRRLSCGTSKNFACCPPFSEPFLTHTVSFLAQFAHHDDLAMLASWLCNTMGSSCNCVRKRFQFTTYQSALQRTTSNHAGTQRYRQHAALADRRWQAVCCQSGNILCYSEKVLAAYKPGGRLGGVSARHKWIARGPQRQPVRWHHPAPAPSCSHTRWCLERSVKAARTSRQGARQNWGSHCLYSLHTLPPPN